MEGRFQQLTAPWFDQVYALFEEAFPPVEHRPREGQRALLEQPAYHLWGLVSAKDQLDALLAAWELEELRFLEHLAVKNTLRSKGIGAALLQWYLAKSERPVVLEVEPPTTQLAARRIGFYQRQGFHLNTYPYMQPPLQPDTQPIPLMLMSWPAPLTSAAFEQQKEAIYRQVYFLK